MNNLDKNTMQHLLNIMGEPVSGNKDELKSRIMRKFNVYKRYKNKTLNTFTKIRKIGTKSKEGICYIVEDNDKSRYVMKEFPKKKSYKSIRKEAEFQSLASSENIAPFVHNIDLVHKYIVMDIMDIHLTEHLENTNGKLSKKHQKEILNIFKTLDNLKIEYLDPNIQNFMMREGKIYLIDYGMCKMIKDDSKPNMTLLKTAFVIHLKEAGCHESSYSLLL